MKLTIISAVIVALSITAMPAYASSVENRCVVQATGSDNLESALVQVATMSSVQLRDLIYACSLDQYPESGEYESSRVSLCSTLSPVETIGAGHVWLLGSIAKGVPSAELYIGSILDDKAITLHDKNSLCQIIETETKKP